VHSKKTVNKTKALVTLHVAIHMEKRDRNLRNN